VLQVGWDTVQVEREDKVLQVDWDTAEVELGDME